jgi:hypothetical protein
MRLRVTGLILFLLVLVGCARHAPPKSRPSDRVVTLTLKWEAEATRCKAEVDLQEAKVNVNRPVIRWEVIDNCNQSADQEEEKETQLAFRYQPNTQKKWLRALRPIARTTRKHNRDRIFYFAEDRKQPDGSYADYAILYDGHEIADPKVVWGR